MGILCYRYCTEGLNPKKSFEGDYWCTKTRIMDKISHCNYQGKGAPKTDHFKGKIITVFLSQRSILG